ncbi:AraC family transcriptional regulator [Pseudomonas sp. CVAP|uniref:AraC family transcriptional regulator n=1 Tax=Pseudomonas sp. CVAP\|nr:AraC family transcriptional regulator [Pseudomonas sp. CVAP\
MTKMPKTVQRHRDSKSPVKDLRHPAADVFFEVFNIARMRGELLGEAVILSAKVLRFPAGRACFHVVHDGPCRFHLAGRSEAIHLSPGDIVFVPHGQGHHIEGGAFPSRMGKHSDNDAPARITSGVFQFDGSGGQTLMLGLPELLHVACKPDAQPDAVGSREWLSLTIAAMQKEVESPSIGSAVMLSRIIDLMFIWAVRHWLASAPEGVTGWIAALRDPVMGHALALLHAEPGADWTVERLAALVNQSRSNLAHRFGRLVGQSPMRYLTHWRMQLAGQFLSSSSRRVSQIAEELGYQSEAAFSRAFRREFELAPTEYRSRHGRQQP